MRGLVIVLAVVLLACGGKAAPEPKRPEAVEAPPPPRLPAEDEAQVKQAVERFDQGRVDEAVQLLAPLAKKHPGHPVVVHELALAHLGAKQPQEAMAVLETLRGKPHFGGEHYALYASALDMQQKYKESLAMAEEGMAKFPAVGQLYTNAGITALRLDQDQRALEYFESGIERSPAHASNYYWGAKMMAQSPQKPWGLIYGELFLSLVPSGDRAEEVSKLLYDTIDSSIEIGKDGIKIGLNRDNILNADGSPPLTMHYEIAFGTALAGAIVARNGAKGLEAFVQARKSFVEILAEDKAGAKQLPQHPLFDFLIKVERAGHLETYSYWILSSGSHAAFSTWAKKNEAAFGSFADWFLENRLKEGAPGAARKPR